MPDRPAPSVLGLPGLTETVYGRGFRLGEP
jgi:hypothetical protein